MTEKQATIGMRGMRTTVPATEIAGRTIIVSTRWLKIASVRDEELVEGEVISNPGAVVSELKSSKVKADILTFPDAILTGERRYSFPYEWDNVAVVSTLSFTDWWESLPQESRKNARRASKRGVSVRVATFDDAFVSAIKAIYDETPIRQGTRFWHYGKDFETVKMENGTYPERSEFIGAYLQDELIGFIKLVYVERVAKIMQILSKTAQFDKRPMNALLTKAVEVCQEKGMSHLIYSKFTFGNKKASPLAEFKRRNGFKQVDFVRYYVPLTVKGQIALKLKLHRELIEVLPPGLIDFLLKIRSTFTRFLQNPFGRRSARKHQEQGKTSLASVSATEP
jgi:hypothetical protein